MVILRKIELGNPEGTNVEIEINDLCIVLDAAGYRLISTFTYDTTLVLVFVKYQ
jgi:hypothetical protein